VKSAISVASAGTGRARFAPSSWYGAVPPFVSVARVRSRPLASSSISTLTVEVEVGICGVDRQDLPAR